MFRKILVPLDSSSLAERALPVAVHLAQKMQAELVLLSVVWKRLNPLVEPLGYIWVADESEVSGRDQLDQYLDHILEKLAPTKIPMHRLLLEGDEAGGLWIRPFSKKPISLS